MYRDNIYHRLLVQFGGSAKTAKLNIIGGYMTILKKELGNIRNVNLTREERAFICVALEEMYLRHTKREDWTEIIETVREKLIG